MKPTFFIVVISFILLGSCSTINSTKNIEAFEQTLGKNNSKALTEYVNAFESEVLKKKYPSLETDKAYSKLLSDYPNSLAPTKLYNLFTNYNLDKYFKSHLWYEIYAPVDSVWIENSELKVKYVYLSVDGKKDVGEIESEFKPKMNRDSIIKNEMGVCYFNSKGKYRGDLNFFWIESKGCRDLCCET